MTSNATSSIATLQQRAADLHAAEKSLYLDLNAFFKGKSVRILCPHYNGQVCGTSKPKLHGRVLPVTWAVMHNGRICLGFEDHQSAVDLASVEVLP